MKPASLLRNSLLNLTGKAVPLILALLLVPYILHGMGTERFGILSLAWAILIYSSVANLGMSQATTTFIAQALQRDEERAVPNLFWTSLVAHAVMGLVGGLLLAGLVPLLVKALKIPPALLSEATAAFYWLAAAVPALVISSSLNAVLVGVQRFDLVNLVLIPINALNISVPALAVFFHRGLDTAIPLLVLVRVLNGLTLFLCCMAGVAALRAHRGTFQSALLRPLLTYGGWVALGTLLASAMLASDRLFVGSLISLAAVAYFSAPYEIVTKMWIVPSAVSQALFPAFASLHSAGRQADCREIYLRWSQILLLLLVLISGVCIGYAEPLLTLWLGSDFAQQGTVVMQLLALGTLANSLAFIPYQLLYGIERPDVSTKILLLQLPLYFLLMWVLAYYFGLAGAGLAWSLRALVDYMAHLVVSNQLIGVKASDMRPFMGTVTWSLAWLLVLAIVAWVGPSSWPGLLLGPLALAACAGGAFTAWRRASA